MKSVTMSMVAVVGLASAAFGGWGSSPKPLFDSGKTEWTAVVAADADCTIQRAVAEFTNAIFKVSGVAMPVAAERPKNGSAVVFTVNPDNDEDEHLSVKLTDDKTLEISGNKSRAVLYASLRFLKEQLGVRWLWYADDGAFFPPKKTWSFPKDYSYSYTPPIAYRGWHTCGRWRDIQKFREWMGHNCLNAQRHTIIDTVYDKDRWISWGFIPMWSDHLAHVDRSQFKDHPEWFSLLDGRRTTEAICYKSEGAREFVANKIDAYLQKHPRTELVSFFPEDNMDYCRCDECKKSTVSDNWFAFYNSVVAKLRPTHPKTRFSTLAYQGYLMPPKDPENYPKDCAFIEVCTHNRCNIHPFSDMTCRKNNADRRHYEEWVKTGVPMGSYTYEYNLFGPARFAPLFTFAEDAVKMGHKYAPRCFIPEIALSPLTGPDTNAKVPVDRMTVQFYADLMWDPTLTFDKWLDDITPYAFGEAAPEMKEYFKILDKSWYTQQNCTGYYKNPLDFVESYYTPIATNANAALAKAEAKIAKTSDERSKANVYRERVLLNQWRDLKLTREGKLKVAHVLPCGERPGVLDDATQPPRELLTKEGKPTGIAMRLGWVTKTLSNKHDGKPWPHAILVKLSGVKPGTQTAIALTNEYDGKERVYREPRNVDGEDVYFEIPFDDMGEQFEPSSVWYIRAQAKLENGTVCGYPAGGGKYQQITRSYLKQTGRKFLLMNAWTDAEKGRPNVLMSGDGLGWDTTFCTTGPQLAAADIEHIPALWFFNSGYATKANKIQDAEWDRVKKAVENGAVAFFGAYYSVQTGKIFGDGYAAVCDGSIGKIPVGNKVADYLAPGDWNKNPYNFSRHKPESLCYANRPADQKGWNILFTVKNKSGQSVPYISCKPYGKGLVFLVGENFGVNRFQFADNALRNIDELRKGAEAK